LGAFKGGVTVNDAFALGAARAASGEGNNNCQNGNDFSVFGHLYISQQMS
jgi:hypothetical protein